MIVSRPLALPHLVILLLAMLVPASPAVTMEWLGDDELESSCDAFLDGSTDKDAALCLAFMQGFLAGAVAAPGARPPDPASSDGESYSERAARTRLGTLRMMQLRADQPDYCLDDSLSAVQIVETVAGYLETHEDALRLTNAEAVYEALVHEFPCDP